MANRGHGEGSVYRLQSGKWAAAIVVGRDAAGKRRKKILYGDTKREVTEALTRLQNQKLDGVLQPTVKLTVSDMLDRWLTSWATGLENNTRLKYRQMADKYINPKLGGIQVERLTSLHIDSLLDSVRESGVGPRTSQYVFSTIRRALNMAMRRKLVVRNVCDGVEPPRADKQQVKAMSAEQVNGLLADVQGTRWEALFVLAITGGFRQGELFALEWGDVDLQAGTVTVRQSLEEINGVFKLKTPKSKSGIRRVAVPAMAVEALHAHRRLMMLEGRAAAATVFCNSIGGFISKQNFYNHTWKPIRARVGLKGFTFHSLRHASASLLLRSGIHPKVVQERLGHSDIAMTLGIYSHLLEGMDGGAADAMQSALKNAKSANGCKLATNGVSGDAGNEKPADTTRCASAG